MDKKTDMGKKTDMSKKTYMVKEMDIGKKTDMDKKASPNPATDSDSNRAVFSPSGRTGGMVSGRGTRSTTSLRSKVSPLPPIREVSDVEEAYPYIAPEWSAPWDDELLEKQIREAVDPDEDARKFIFANVLRSLRDSTLERGNPTWDAKKAFYVADFDEELRLSLCTRYDESLERLFTEVVPHAVPVRDVHAFTPSVLTTILLGDSRHFYSDPDDDLMYIALRRHLSRSIGDRFFSAVKSKNLGSSLYESWSITVPYFDVTRMEPPEEIAPLAPAWPFGIHGLLTEYGPTARNVSSWTLYNLEEIAGKWEQVMDLLEEQTSVPINVIFDGDMRQNLLFDDSDFTDARRYFWAIQSLRVFDEHIAGTIRLLSNFFHSIRVTDLYFFEKREEESAVRVFTELRERESKGSARRSRV
ncbi:hypothetical protein VTH82DRAFT_3510 [Thermothelomyces myriococcoides]